MKRAGTKQAPAWLSGSQLALIPSGCDPIWHRAPTHKVQKYNLPTAGGVGGRERDANRKRSEIFERQKIVGCKKERRRNSGSQLSIKFMVWAP